ncbi:hypothetical protein D3C81_1326450 [compost metagenome]
MVYCPSIIICIGSTNSNSIKVLFPAKHFDKRMSFLIQSVYKLFNMLIIIRSYTSFFKYLTPMIDYPEFRIGASDIYA